MTSALCPSLRCNNGDQSDPATDLPVLAGKRNATRIELVAVLATDGDVPPVDIQPPRYAFTTVISRCSQLESLQFPATGTEIVATVGDREIVSTDGAYALGELIPDTDEETFDSPTAVRVAVQRPTVAATMKRILEASETLPNADLRGSRREAYEKTFRELKAIDAADDEGIQVVSDWIVEQIRDKGKLPGSRAVRRRAAKFCRANGYQVRNDEWLGI